MTKEIEAGIVYSLAFRVSLVLARLSITNWFTLSLALLVGRALYYAVFHPLAQIPGPFSVRVGIPSLRFLGSCRNRWPWELLDLHRQYGDTVRTGPNTVSVIDPDAVHAVYAYGNNYAKASFYTAFQPLKNKPSLFSDLDPHSHALRRRTIAHVYTMKSLSVLEDYIEPCVSGIVKAFDSVIGAASGGQAHVEMQKWLHYFASDAVGELAFGRSLNLLGVGKDDGGFLPAVTNLSIYGSIAGTLPSISPLINKYFRSTTLFSPSIIGKVTWERIQDRLALMSSKNDDAIRQDMLAGFMKSKYPGTDIPLEPPEVAALASSVISAGSDTTAIALSAFFYYILTNDAVYYRVQREVDAAYDAGTLKDGEPVRYAQGVKLEYLQACVKESMRLITPFVMDMLRVVPREGLMVGKWFLPAGTEVGTNPYVFHRNKRAFGEDASVFRPDSGT